MYVDSGYPRFRAAPRCPPLVGLGTTHGASDPRFEISEFGAGNGLAAQLVRHHRRRGMQRTYHADAFRLALHCTASSGRRKSPSPENSTMWSTLIRSVAAREYSSLSGLLCPRGSERPSKLAMLKDPYDFLVGRANKLAVYIASIEIAGPNALSFAN